MTVLKQVDECARGWLRNFARWKDGVQLAHVPVGEDAYEQTLRHLLSRGAHGHRNEPEPGGGSTSWKVTTRRPSTVTEVAVPSW